jgi:flagellin-like protein
LTSETQHDEAVSPQIGTILMVAIVVLLAALIILMFHLPDFSDPIRPIPSFLEISGVYHTDEHGILNYDSRVILLHNGTERFENAGLRAEFFRNGTKISAVIETMNGNEFISTHHFGVQTMGGLGCSGLYWDPKEKIAIDFSDNTFHFGDTIRVDIFNKESGELVSRHSKRT